MSQVSDQAKAPNQSASDGRIERRRPGRPESAHPALLPLLRRDRLLQDALVLREDDDLASARGIGLGVIVGVVLWGGLALLVWWLFAG